MQAQGYTNFRGRWRTDEEVATLLDTDDARTQKQLEKAVAAEKQKEEWIREQARSRTNAANREAINDAIGDNAPVLDPDKKDHFGILSDDSFKNFGSSKTEK